MTPRLAVIEFSGTRPRPGAFDPARYLSLQPLFQALGAGQLQALAQRCVQRRLLRGETLFRIGERCEAIHVVVTGQVKLFLMSDANHEKVIEFFGPGQCLAEPGLFTGQPAAVSAQVLADALVLSIDREALLDAIVHDPSFALRLLAAISARLHGLVRDVQAYALHNGTQRVIGYLLREHDAEGSGEAPVTVSLPVNKATVASRLSLTPQHFSRVLHELESVGLLRIDRRDVHIPDPKALAAYAPG